MAAPTDYAASVQGVAMRVTKLNPNGSLSTADGDSATTTSFIRVSFTPEYEEGDEITEKAADGTVCVSFKAPDTLKRCTIEVAICEPDPLVTFLLSGGVILTAETGTKAVGWASPQVGEDPSGDGVAVEVWSYAVQDGKRAPNDPYYHWIFPYVKTRQSGDRAIENGLLANTFEGFGLGNSNFDIGPDGRWDWPASSDRPYSYARSSWAPVGYKGIYNWDASTGDATEISSLATIPGALSPGINTPGMDGYTPPPDYLLDADDDA